MISWPPWQTSLRIHLPDDAAEDSVSILPLLVGQQTTLPGRPMVIHHGFLGEFAIRNGKWKLIEDGPQLFDLVADPKESHNVAEQHPEVVKELLGRLESVSGQRPLCGGRQQVGGLAGSPGLTGRLS